MLLVPASLAFFTSVLNGPICKLCTPQVTGPLTDGQEEVYLV